MDVQTAMPPPPPPPPAFFAETSIPLPPPPPPPPPAFFTETTISPPPPPLPSSSIAPSQPITTSVASPVVQDRVWLHPWTINEMRQNASQWSLAGDAGLLLYLEQFSDKLIQRADAIQQHLGQTVNAVKSTHTRVQNCLNEFTSLANTQFIENRVYDEDETASATSSKKDEVSTDKANVSSVEVQEKVLQRYVEAIQYGLSILETHFERVETKMDNLPNGGASFVDDDEDGGVPIEPILEPKDPYIFRPLPHLIGTTEFMDDDYVGLGMLLNAHEEDPYDVEKHKKSDTDSALSGSDTDDDDFEVQPVRPSIVEAGASRPDQANAQLPSSTQFDLNMGSSDEDGDDDKDPFRDLDRPEKFDDSPSLPKANDDNLFERPVIPTKSVKTDSIFDSDSEEDNLFDDVNNKPLPTTKTNNDDSDDQSSVSKESEEVKKPKPQIGGVTMFGGGAKGMSELERRVMKRREDIGDLGFPSDDEDTTIRTKRKETANESILPSTVKFTPKPPPTTVISQLTDQPLTKPTQKSSGSSLFGQTHSDDEDGDDEDIFGVISKPPTVSTVKPPTTTKTETVPTSHAKAPRVEKKEIFESSSEEDEGLFTPKNKSTLPDTVIKKSDSNSKLSSTASKSTKHIFEDNEDEGDDFFTLIKPPVKPSLILPATTAPKSQVANSSDASIDTSKSTKAQTPTVMKTKNLPDDDDSDDGLFREKIPAKQQVVPPPIPSPAPPVSTPVKNRIPTDDESSEEEMFRLSTDKRKKTTPVPQKAVLPPLSSGVVNPISPLTIKPKPPTMIPTKAVQLSDEDEDKLFGLPTRKSEVLPKLSREDVPDKNNEEEDLFSTNSQQGKLTSQDVVPTPLLLPVVNKTVAMEDSSSITSKPVETPTRTLPIPSVQSTKKSPLNNEEDDDDDSGSTRQINKGAPEDGQIRSVRDIVGVLKIPLDSHLPGARRKPPPAKEEPAKSSVDDTSAELTSQPSPSPVVKKTSLFDSDSDDDFLNKKKKEPMATPTIEEKKTTSIESESGKSNIKDISSRIKINPQMLMPGAQSRPILNKETLSNTSPEITPSETAKAEPTGDVTVTDMLKGRARVSAKRAPPTRTARLAATATTSTNENDDLFGLPSVASTTALPHPSHAPTVEPVVSLPSPPIVVSSPTTVTGLPDTPAAISNKKSDSKEKKKFSLFDSDDSDIDEMLFGSKKKNNSSPAPKVTKTASTTSKASAKPSALLFDDDGDDDFLSKRPVKKSTKPVDNDDIFADVKAKSQPTNKAKKDWSIMNKSTANETDDIFNETATKSITPSKPKASNVKNKSSKDLDDIFDDPLNVASKR